MATKKDDETPIAVLRERKTETLKVRLTDAELLSAGKKLADEEHELQRIEDDRKDAAANFKAQAEAHQKQINLLAMMVATGEEYRPVECEVVTDFDARTVTTSRTDTGEVIGERPMREDEAQVPMDAMRGV